MTEKGKYIVLEGSDGTGKTTVANLLAKHFINEGRHVIRVDEPDSPRDESGEILVPIAAKLRSVIKDGSLARSAFTNLLLFTASRAQSWHEVLAPALDEGGVVISARNYWSTLAYQGYGEGYSLAEILRITEDSLGAQYMYPDYGYILELANEAERTRRIGQRGLLEKPDTFESRSDEFQKSVRAGYHSIAQERGVPIIPVDGQLPKEVADAILKRIKH